ncbi:Calreticulin family-domain-containing protein [Absidia repens]|uniref:Calreticulin n=1 Tax=Absidia repens TaxID=90262 RepID=A0A1X2IA95_9FUNG|nr:Calreticulin family-domain-containing protein [Absidia repens]
MKIPTIATILGLSTLACAEVFLHETFSDGDNWTQRWTPSTHRADLGVLEVSSGKWAADAEKNTGLRTTEDYRFYATSTKFDKPFDNKDKDFVVQFDVKNEQKIDCGGSYVKIFSDKFDAKTFNGDSEYNIMFGPDICGTKSIVHAILQYKGKNFDLKKTVAAPTDVFTHTYTLVIKPNQTYQVLVDGEEKAAGKLEEDWDFLPPKTIKDPEASKPADWVDEAEIDDPTDVKPADWDNTPEFVADPEAVKPEDWDDDMDGEWEAPSITNPDYKGEWSPKRIANPDYKGEWEHPEIDNPEYKLDDSIYHYNFENIGFDLWQVKSGTIFDNILITDDVDEAKKVRDESLALAKDEVKAKDAYDEQEKSKIEAEIPTEDKSSDSEPLDIDLDDLSVESDTKEEVKENKPAKDEL